MLKWPLPRAGRRFLEAQETLIRQESIREERMIMICLLPSQSEHCLVVTVTLYLSAVAGGCTVSYRFNSRAALPQRLRTAGPLIIILYCNTCCL
jgi:hypothetical protein